MIHLLVRLLTSMQSHCLQKVDLWSLGVSIYFLLCGVDPFHGLGDEAERKRLTGQIEFPFGSDVPSREARNFVQGLLQPNARNRLSAAEALRHVWMEMDDASLDDISLAFAYELLECF